MLRIAGGILLAVFLLSTAWLWIPVVVILAAAVVSSPGLLLVLILLACVVKILRRL